MTRRPPEPTRLQEVQQAVVDLLRDARDELDDRSFRAWVVFLIVRVAREAVRVANWERHR